MQPQIFCLAFSLTLFSILSPTIAINGGFSADLVHRDSPKSPYYNPLENPYQRVRNAIDRSISHGTRFNPSFVSPNTAQSTITTNQGEYLMNISIGSPPFKIMAIADTGSDLVWTQCKPCSGCYAQVAPLFDPKASSTYKDVSCSSSQCSSMEGTSCSEEKSSCMYSASYGDGSYSNGNLAVDTITLGSTSGRPVPLPKTVFGCGHDNAGTFDKKGSGIVGLGGGEVSLISQMGSSIGGKFSYCLVPIFSETKQSSKINFGSAGIVSGSEASSTPLVAKDPSTFYYLTLEAMSVGDKKIKFGGSAFGTSEGNIIIDSGTTLTLLPEDFYSEVEAAVKSAIDAEPVPDPQQVLSLCYDANSELKIPIVTVHFTGADLKLQPVNTFVRISEKLVCFSFRPYESGAIYGNLAQMNFLVGYDLQEQTVSFKPTDCTKV